MEKDVKTIVYWLSSCKCRYYFYRTTPVHAENKQYWTESKERVGIVEK